MPTWLAKTDEMLAVDEFFGIDDIDELRGRYDAALERLTSGIDLSGGDWAAVDDSAKADSALHFGADWLSGDWWPNVAGEVVQEKIRVGLIGAMTTARDAGLPMSLVWVTGDPDYESRFFEVDHVAGPRAVTVVIATPWPKRTSRPVALGV